MNIELPQLDLIGRRFRPIRMHPATHGRVAVVLRVQSAKTTNYGAIQQPRLSYRYEDSPPGAVRKVAQRWFLASFTPVDPATTESL